MNYKFKGEVIPESLMRYHMQFTSPEENKAIYAYRDIQKKTAAIDRMNREKNPTTKREMRELINQEIYNLDTIFGPEK